MRFVPVASVEQQSGLCVHRLREGLKAERAACINRIRGLQAQFGLACAQSPEALRRVLTDVLEEAAIDLVGLGQHTRGLCRVAGLPAFDARHRHSRR